MSQFEPPQQQNYASVPIDTQLEGDEKTNVIIMYVVGGAFSLIGVFIAWLIFRESSRKLDIQGKWLINFCLTFIIAISIFIVIHFAIIYMIGIQNPELTNEESAFFIAFMFIPPILFSIYCLIITVIAMIGFVNSLQGKIYKLPLSIPFLR